MLGRVADRLKLYVVPGSHPCAAVERALQLKGLAYDRVDLIPVLHAVHQRIVFGRRTVPALKLPDGEKVVGTRAILRVLDGLEAVPPLLPAEPVLRSKVEAAEQWGDEDLQPRARRIGWHAMVRRTDAIDSYTAEADLPLPRWMTSAAGGTVARMARAANRAGDEAVRADLAALPGALDRIDGLIADGVIGGDAVNAADLQIGSSLRLLGTFGDLRPLLEDRPAGALALRVFPHYPGSTPAGVLPAEWLPTR
jgi:glutathione S-transferase